MDAQEKIARASDILEQIDKLNEIVDFHKKESNEASMIRQYELMRKEFLKELEEVLNQFQINVTIEEKAA